MGVPFDTGSHLKTSRLIYEHHGVYIGDGLVIHYADDGIRIDTLEDFSKGFGIEVVLHLDSPFTGREIRSRAISRLGEDAYDLVFNNCEHFANWCCMGREESEQVKDVIYTLADAILNIVNGII